MMGLLGLFSKKSARDLKRLQPVLDAIAEHRATLKSLSHDALRARSADIRASLQEKVSELDETMKRLRIQAKNTEDLHEKEGLFSRVSELEQERKKQMSAALDACLPEVFAIVQETAQRFANEEALIVTANESDRRLAARKNYVSIQGDKSHWASEWLVADVPVRWNMVHYEVQLMGAMVLHQGKIAEMATGEGKTLVATLPAFLNALSGQGVHLVTVNDYLARRDAEWNAPLFEFHGLSVDCIDIHEPNSEARRRAYAADIVYGTNNEFGFDYLRDNMVRSESELVQRGHAFAMVDEVDSVLIDEARTPLIISGPVGKQADAARFMALRSRVHALVQTQRNLCTQLLNEAKKAIAAKETAAGGTALFRVHRGLPKYKPLIRFLSETGMKQLLQKTENKYLADNQRLMPEADAPLYFTIDEKNNSIQLTEKGVEALTQSGEEKDFFVLFSVTEKLSELDQATDLSAVDRAEKREALMREYGEKSARLHAVQQLLRAYTLYERDTEYVVVEGKVKIVDEQTGRMLEGRRYGDGLHQALEAKENVRIEDSTQTYATITLQNYFRMYDKLAGMTGTAETEAGEFWNIYQLDVVVIPTHEAVVRKDYHDKVYKTMREKFNAVIEEIEALTKAGRPVLVGTTSVEISELLSRMLKMRRITHQVLNALHHQKEAEIIAEAGKPSTVTIATNMAGRGTDIKLSEASRSAGGLAILGTERHESRRVDRQLRGRAGRQGDPGSSQFFSSLEDNLMRLFGSDRLGRWMDRMGLKEGEVIQHSMITRSIERAQKKVEENNFGIRKRLLEYDNVMNAQREVIYARRRHALSGEKLQLDLYTIFHEWVADTIGEVRQQEDAEAVRLALMDTLGQDLNLTTSDLQNQNQGALHEEVYGRLCAAYKEKKIRIQKTTQPVLQHAFASRGEQLQDVRVPLSAGDKQLGVQVQLKTAIDTQGQHLVEEIEKAVVLACIDQEWKEHLRAVDDLRQSVQNVVYEQKDPLLIYKFEAYELFKGLLSVLRVRILSFLMLYEVPTPEPEALALPGEQVSTTWRGRREEKASLATDSGASVPLNVASPAQRTTAPRRPATRTTVAGRNERVTVQHPDGTLKKEIKYKKVAADVEQQRCVVIEVHR